MILPRSHYTTDSTKVLPNQIPPSRSFSISPYLRLARLDKPIGTWLLLWPCIWSITLATPHGQVPDIRLLALFTLGAVVMRGAGCTINDIIDRDFDRQVARTKTRPIASGDVTVPQAIAFLALQCTIGLGVLLSLNFYTIGLGVMSLLLVGTYPLMKRITYWPQMVLGLTFNWGVLMGYSAVAGICDWKIVLPLYLAGICWTLVYDTIYAHQDKEDDLKIGVKSTAIRFGENTKQWLQMFGAGTLIGLIGTGVFAGASWPFWVMLPIAAAHLMWQIGTVDINNGQDCLEKFISNKWFGFIVWAGILISNFV